MKQKNRIFGYGCRRLAAWIVFVAIVTGVLSGYGSMTARAAKSLGMYTASTAKVGVVSELSAYDHGILYYHTLGGETAYCLDYGKSASNGQSMITTVVGFYTKEQEKQLEYCMAFGHHAAVSGNPTNAQKNEFIATQAMVWIIMENVYKKGETTVKSIGNKFCRVAPNPDASKSYFDSLYAKMQAGSKTTLPSFAAESRSDLSKTKYKNFMKDSDKDGIYTKSMTDTNKVFGQYFNFSCEDSRVTVSKKGAGNNTLLASAKDTALKDKWSIITLTNMTGAVELSGKLQYFKVDDTSYQRFVMGQPKTSPVIGYCKVKLKMTYGDIRVKKVDTDHPDKVLEGAVFGLFATEADAAAEVNELERQTSGEDGFAEFGEIDAGTYYIKELEAPKGYEKSNEVVPVTVKAGQTADTEVIMTNDEVRGSLEVCKYGQVVTGYTDGAFTYRYDVLPGIRFQVYADEDIYDGQGVLQVKKDTVVSKTEVPNAYGETITYPYVETKDNGKATVKYLYPGRYRIYEMSADRPYIQDYEPQYVTVTAEDIASVNMPSVTFYNDWQEYDVAAEKRDADKKTPIKGAVFELYVATDIHAFGKTIITKDTVLRRAESDEDGYLAFDIRIPHASEQFTGSFCIREVSVPAPYILDKTPHQIDNANKNTPSYVKLDYQPIFTNERAKVHIRLIKKDSDTNQPLSGAVFRLYAAEDILAANGSVIYAKDAEVASGVSGKDGVIDFGEELPLGEYYAKETKAPKGFSLYEEKISLTASYVDSDTPVVLLEREVGNTPVSVTITKTDITGENELSGAELVLHDKQGYVIDSWTSEAGKPHVIKDLTAGEAYTLHENLAPLGYANTSDITFTAGEESQHIIMKDEAVKGRILLYKTEEETGEPLSGIRFQVKTAAGDLAAELVTDKNGYAQSELLPIGIFEDGIFKEPYTYILEEVETGEGYVLDERKHEFSFSYVDGSVPVVTREFHISNTRAKGRVELYKTDDAKAPLEGVEYEIRDDAGKVLETLVTDKNGYAQSSLLDIGRYEKGSLQEFYVYHLVEVKAKKGMKLDKTDHEFYFDSDGKNQTVITKEFHFTNEYDIQLFVKKSTIRRTQCGDTYQYTIDEVSNQSGCGIFDFTMTDVLPGEVLLENIHTGTYNASLRYSVSYRLAGEEKWRSWAEDISTTKDNVLEVSALKLDKEQQIAAFRFSFGKVPAGFGIVDKPVYFVTVKKGLDVSTEMENHIRLEGHRYGIKKKSEDKTVTLLFENHIEVQPEKDIENRRMVPNRDVLPKTMTPKTGDARDMKKTYVLFISSAIGITVILQKRRRRGMLEKQKKGR